MEAVRVCTKCGAEKPRSTDFFYAKSGCQGNLSSHCKECVKADMRIRHQAKRAGLRLVKPDVATLWSLRSATDVEKAWMAGFVDGEGTIGSKSTRNTNRVTYSVKAHIENTEASSLVLFVALYGGSVLLKRQATTECRETYVWYCPAATRQRFLLDIKPYLRLKIRQAELVLEFIALGDGRSHRSKEGRTESWRLRVAPDTLYEAQRTLHEDLIELNRRGPR